MVPPLSRSNILTSLSVYVSCLSPKMEQNPRWVSCPARTDGRLLVGCDTRDWENARDGTFHFEWNGLRSTTSTEFWLTGQPDFLLVKERVVAKTRCGF